MNLDILNILTAKAAPEVKKEKYACYGCGGDSNISHKCEVCRGWEFVTDDDRLAIFFMAILRHKLGLNPSSSSSNAAGNE